jgi:dTDP-4-amino-4,6-dideoxygalactose transaminase
MIVTNRHELWRRAYSFSDCGREPNGPSDVYTRVASNYRMPELMAALLFHQLDRLTAQSDCRRRSAEFLRDALADVEGLEPQVCKEYVQRHTYSLYCLRFSSAAFGGMSRDEFAFELQREGFRMNRGHRVFYETPMFRNVYQEMPHLSILPARPDYSSFECPVAEGLSRDVVWFRHGLLLDPEAELTRFVNTVRRIQRKSRRSRTLPNPRGME